jgi:hypothetical protein
MLKSGVEATELEILAISHKLHFNIVLHQNSEKLVEYISHTPKQEFGVIHLSYHTTKRMIGNFKSVQMKDRFNSIRRRDDPIYPITQL